jgi:hypothetical protein
MTKYANTVPAWTIELRMRLAAQQKAAEAKKTAAKAARVQIANAGCGERVPAIASNS